MQKFLARENIKHFRELLETELDGERRQTISALLHTEERRLEILPPEPRATSRSTVLS